MRTKIFAMLLAFSSFSALNAQITTDSTRYVYGDLGVQQVAPVNINSQSSCADTLGIAIALMTLPNLIGIFLLRKDMKQSIADYKNHVETVFKKKI